MKHSIDIAESGPYAESMAEAVETCVHCGFCLPACPTYQELGQEADSPRGRIFLMKRVLEDELKADDIAQQVDQCLGCLACETACPSGVKYRDLISPYRATNKRKKSFWERVRDRLVAWTLPYPWRFRWAMRLGRWTRFLSFLAPKKLKPMTEMIPDSIPPRVRLAAEYPSEEKASKVDHGKVILLAGCAQQVLAPQINLNTIRLLNFCGVSVSVPPHQSCCGALAWHTGDDHQARKLAARNFEYFGGDFDWLVTNTAGCGSGIKEYGVLFKGSEMEDVASQLAAKTIDISLLLSKLGFAERLRSCVSHETPQTKRVAYHDACHLSNGQHVRSEPRELLRSVPGVELCELGSAEVCCGSAGTYNIEQPDIAKELGRKKANAVQATSAEILVTGNIGCIVQIQNHLKAIGSSTRVMHLVDFLAAQIPTA